MTTVQLIVHKELMQWCRDNYPLPLYEMHCPFMLCKAAPIFTILDVQKQFFYEIIISDVGIVITDYNKLYDSFLLSDPDCFDKVHCVINRLMTPPPLATVTYD